MEGTQRPTVWRHRSGKLHASRASWDACLCGALHSQYRWSIKNGAYHEPYPEWVREEGGWAIVTCKACRRRAEFRREVR